MISSDSQIKLVDLEEYMRRLADVTCPTRSPVDGDSRENSRQNRVLPTIMVPWEDGAPVIDEAATALTKDVSDRGIGVVLRQPFRAKRVAIYLWLTDEERPWFFGGEVRQNSSIGGGYWVIGVELTEMLSLTDVPQLARIMSRVKKLLPVERQRRPSELLNG